MSIWWSPNPMNQTVSASSSLASLQDWYQVKFKPSPRLNKYQILNEQGDEVQVENEEETSVTEPPSSSSSSSSSEQEADSNRSSFVEINIVNCMVKAASCGQCMDQQLIALGCGWCKTSSKCTMRKDCSSSSSSSAFWLNDLSDSNPNSYCADPLIQSMMPRCGPRPEHGGSNLVILGENLGRTAKDVRVKLRPILALAESNLFGTDLNCQVLEDLYKKASRIVCNTSSSPDMLASLTTKITRQIQFSVFVETNINSLALVYSSFNQSNRFVFEYVTPEVHHVEPRRGIRSGGTLLKIIGKHLSCGSNFTLKLMPLDQACVIVNVSSIARHQISHLLFNYDSANEDSVYDVVYCRTPPAPIQALSSQRSLNTLRIQMDAYTQTLSESLHGFEYVEDPQVTSIKPERTIVSGGLILTVNGHAFDTLQSAHILLASQPILAVNQRAIMYNSELHSNVYIFKSKCVILNATHIQCIIPQIRDKRLSQPSRAASSSSSSSTSTNSMDYSVYVEFNELTNRYASHQHIQVFPDPWFDETPQQFSDKTPIILIKGENLLRGVKETDYKILIGPNAECNVTSITMSMIACILPDFSLTHTTDHAYHSLDGYIQISRLNKRALIQHNKQPASYDVRVQIGHHFIRSIGVLRFEKDLRVHSRYELLEIRFIVFAACTVSFALFITMISCFVVLKRRQNRQIRQLKRMQNEFENLEMRVARECKEAFTELQMDIGELVASTLNQTGAPFNDFQTYCIKILFPNSSEADRFMLSSVDLRMSGSLLNGKENNLKSGVSMLSHLLMNKKFLITFVHTLEADSHTFLLQDRVNLASYLSVCLYEKFDYFTE